MEDIISLVFPNICVCCTQVIPPSQKWLCTNCLYDLPKSANVEYGDSYIEKKLYSKFPFQKADSFLIFKEKNKTQKLLHAIKYSNKPELATFLGIIYSKILIEKKFFQDINLIIPVPLHSKKQKQRGYNQSESFALGISKTTSIPLKTNYLFRPTYTETQTKKSKIDRIKNVQNAFSINSDIDLSDNHVLLVDDVVTTGATLEACAKTLSTIKIKNLSVVTLAAAE